MIRKLYVAENLWIKSSLLFNSDKNITQLIPYSKSNLNSNLEPATNSKNVQTKNS